MIKNSIRIWWTALIVAWFFDFLFWEKSPGVSFPLFVGILLVAGLILSRLEEKPPARVSIWLLLPIVVFALGTFLRREPFTTFTNYLLTLVLLGVLAHTFQRGRWLNYSLSDYIAVFFFLLISALARPIEFLSAKKNTPDETNANVNPSKISRWKRLAPILRGVLIAFPIIVVFASLLATADPIFADYLDNFIKLFRLENLPEYIFRGVYILILGYLLTGIYIHAFTSDKDMQLIGEDIPWLPTFLGFTESAIVLGSVDILFAAFVAVQFRYFFGGETNIKIDGYTYAEYARRGFGELVIVAVFSLLLFIGLSTLTRRDKSIQRKTFSGLGIGLMVLVAVILVSAFQRLSLYEQAYGFTRLRTYSYVFMVWLGLLLAAVVVLELFKKQRAFALASMFAAIGFVLTLNILNVDGLIVRKNVQRVLNGGEVIVSQEVGNRDNAALDAYYLQSLSTDATPALIDAQQNPQLAEEYRNELSATLACQITLLLADSDKVWQTFHWADHRALQLLETHRADFSAAQIYENESGSWWVKVNHKDRPCRYDPYAYY